jgi:mono/diheme cytochrome c family protein
MYTGLLHAHTTFVLLFLLHYVLKLVLLLTNRKEQLERYSKSMRIPEMVLSVGFLVTGIWMLVSTSAFTNLLIIKLICVFASIPLAVIGFKKKNKVLASVAVLLIVAAYGLAEMNKKAKTGPKVDTSSIKDPIEAGKLIYSNTCINCHGADGKLGGSGSKDLSQVTISVDEQKAIIRNGKNAMPGYRDLSDEQIDAVVQYIGTLKQ